MKPRTVCQVASLLMLFAIPSVLNAQSFGVIQIPQDQTYGYWDEASRTYTFTQNVLFDTVVITQNDMIVDGGASQGVTISGPGRTHTIENDGIRLTGKSGVTLHNLRIENYSYGILLEAGCSQNVVRNNVISAKSACAAGIQILNSSGNILEGNELSGMYMGIWLEYSTNNTCNNNDIYGIRDDEERGMTTGIMVNFSSHNTILENTVHDALWGSMVKKDSNRNLLRGNNLSKNVTGLWIREASHFNTVENNVCSNNDPQGLANPGLPSDYILGRGIVLSAGATNNLILNNTAIANFASGIDIFQANDNTLDGNTCTNSYGGIWLRSASGNEIVDNLVKDNSNVGLDIMDGANSNLIRQNTLENNGWGIAVKRSSYDNQIFNNNIVGNRVLQVMIRDGLDNQNSFHAPKPDCGNYWGDHPEIGTSDFPLLSPYIFNGGVDALPWAMRDGWLDPKARAQVLISQVADLVEAGLLAGNQEKPLTVKLDAAIKSIEKGKDQTAVNQLGAFINKVDALLKSRRLAADDGQILIDSASKIIALLGGKASKPTLVASEVSLSQPFPNPANPSTSIQYTLEKASAVRASIFNLLGQEVRTLVKENQSAGIHSISWDARDNAAREVTSGVYIFRLDVNASVLTRKILILK